MEQQPGGIELRRGGRHHPLDGRPLPQPRKRPDLDLGGAQLEQGVNGRLRQAQAERRAPRTHGGNHADKKNKRPFGTPLAAPLQRTWCWQGGAGWGRGALQECLGG